MVKHIKGQNNGKLRTASSLSVHVFFNITQVQHIIACILSKKIHFSIVDITH